MAAATLATREYSKLVEVASTAHRLKITVNKTDMAIDAKDIIKRLSFRKILYLENIATFMQNITAAIDREIIKYKAIRPS